jgi:hypothetical protein
MVIAKQNLNSPDGSEKPTVLGSLFYASTKATNGSYWALLQNYCQHEDLQQTAGIAAEKINYCN